MACLETTFLIDLLRGKENVRLLKDKLDETESSLSITPVSIMELWIGASLKSSEQEKENILALINSLEMIPFNLESAKESAEIYVYLAGQGTIIEISDMMIAGISKAHGETVVTRDEHFARISGLKVLKY